MDNEQSTIYFEDTYTYTSFIFLICTLLVYIFGLFIAKNQFPASIFIAILSNSIFVGLVTIIYLLVNYKKEIETRDIKPRTIQIESVHCISLLSCFCLFTIPAWTFTKYTMRLKDCFLVML